MNNNPLARISTWFETLCNGDWEHMNGIKLETLDNPGWVIHIDMPDDRTIPKQDGDGYEFGIEDSQLIGFSDIDALVPMLEAICVVLQIPEVPIVATQPA